MLFVQSCIRALSEEHKDYIHHNNYLQCNPKLSHSRHMNIVEVVVELVVELVLELVVLVVVPGVVLVLVVVVVVVVQK